jgi:hypothetical protein
MSEEPGVRRRRRSRAEVLQLVAEFESGGLSRAEFCRQRKLSVNTLDRYRRRQRQFEQEGDEGRWIAVRVGRPSQAAAPGSGLALALAGGMRIEIAREFDAPALKQLLAVLEQA